MERFRRKPAQERWIAELTDEDKNNPIKLLGTVVDIKSNEDQTIIFLDDGTGQIQAVTSQPQSLETGNQIRIFGILNKIDQDFIIEVQIIQDMKDLDLELFKRVQAVKRRFREKTQE